jgi:hypothetical protein
MWENSFKPDCFHVILKVFQLRTFDIPASLVWPQPSTPSDTRDTSEGPSHGPLISLYGSLVTHIFLISFKTGWTRTGNRSRRSHAAYILDCPHTLVVRVARKLCLVNERAGRAFPRCPSLRESCSSNMKESALLHALADEPHTLSYCADAGSTANKSCSSVIKESEYSALLHTLADEPHTLADAGSKK